MCVCTCWVSCCFPWVPSWYFAEVSSDVWLHSLSLQVISSAWTLHTNYLLLQNWSNHIDMTTTLCTQRILLVETVHSWLFLKLPFLILNPASSWSSSVNQNVYFACHVTLHTLQSSSISSRKLRFSLWRVKLDLYRISHGQASSWVQQGKEWVRWLMRRKEDLRGLAVTWKQLCGNRLYASQCQTWSCWHTSWCWAMSISWDKYDAVCHLLHGGCMRPLTRKVWRWHH